jgi:hypothetical protein
MYAVRTTTRLDRHLACSTFTYAGLSLSLFLDDCSGGLVNIVNCCLRVHQNACRHMLMGEFTMILLLNFPSVHIFTYTYPGKPANAACEVVASKTCATLRRLCIETRAVIGASHLHYCTLVTDSKWFFSHSSPLHLCMAELCTVALFDNKTIHQIEL